MLLANIFQPLIDIFGPVLVFFHSIIGGSWGWSIIALTVVVRALLLPLAFRHMHSMRKLQLVAPQIKAIQAKHKDDKLRQQQEIVNSYRENDINPFATLLPLLAQIPVFIGLFYTLRTRLREDICPGLQAAFRSTPTPRITMSRSAKWRDGRWPAMGSTDRAGCSSTT
jgi:YidC/Oxa1 family membrane protein insertase